MTRARDIANLVDANGDIVAGALDNVPASNDASALTTGTLANARLASTVSVDEIQVESAGGGDFIARFQNQTAATPYGVWVKEPASAANGYPSLQVTDNAGTATRFRVDSGTGYVTKPYQVAFSATPANGNYTTTTPIPFDVVHYNIGNAYNNSTYTFTAPIAGRYVFHLHLGIVRLNAGGSSGYPRFQINGSNKEYSYVSGPSGLYVNANMTTFRVLAANDTVLVTWNGSNSNYYDNTSECSFSGYLLG